VNLIQITENTKYKHREIYIKTSDESTVNRAVKNVSPS
jgi:hypothetical protein